MAGRTPTHHNDFTVSSCSKSTRRLALVSRASLKSHSMQIRTSSPSVSEFSEAASHLHSVKHPIFSSSVQYPDGDSTVIVLAQIRYSSLSSLGVLYKICDHYSFINSIPLSFNSQELREIYPMARHGIILLAMLLAFAIIAGGLMEGVRGSESSELRRLAGHQSLWARAVVVPAATICPITCGGPSNPSFPNCCQNTVVRGFLPVYFCANNQIDNLNCGTCGKSCVASGYTLGDACCSGFCSNTLSDHNNCGFCGNKCSVLDVCRAGMCNNAR